MFGIQVLHIVYINTLQVLTTFTYVRHDTIHRVLWPLSCQAMTPPSTEYFDLDLRLVRHDTTIHGVLWPWPLSCQAWHHHLHNTLTLTFVLSGMTLPFTEYFDLDLVLSGMTHHTWSTLTLTFVLSDMTPPSTEYFDLDLWPLYCQVWHHHPRSTLTLTFVLQVWHCHPWSYFYVSQCKENEK